jgi:hypothetical protein
MTTQPRPISRSEIKSVALIIRQSAVEIAIAMIRSGQFVVGAPGSNSEDLAYYSVLIAKSITLQAFHAAPGTIKAVEWQVDEAEEG